MEFCIGLQHGMIRLRGRDYAKLFLPFLHAALIFCRRIRKFYNENDEANLAQTAQQLELLARGMNVFRLSLACGKINSSVDEDSLLALEEAVDWTNRTFLSIGNVITASGSCRHAPGVCVFGMGLGCPPPESDPLAPFRGFYPRSCIREETGECIFGSNCPVIAASDPVSTVSASPNPGVMEEAAEDENFVPCELPWMFECAGYKDQELLHSCQSLLAEFFTTIVEARVKHELDLLSVQALNMSRIAECFGFKALGYRCTILYWRASVKDAARIDAALKKLKDEYARNSSILISLELLNLPPIPGLEG